jgi:hypothetical protein
MSGRVQSARPPTGSGCAHPDEGNPLCKKLARKQIVASAGAHMFCFGLQRSGPQQVRRLAPAAAPGNVNAADPAEDVSPNGVRVYGQSEVSVAASGRYVVEAWNDSTFFLSPCPSPVNKEEGTGFAFSTDGGKTFTDLGGLPNRNCQNYRFEGDPSVAAYVVGGKTYFYIASLFNNVTTFFGASDIAMDACQVVGSGKGATLHCGQPVIVGTSSQCNKVKVGNTTQLICSFTDKDFIAVDPARGRLYATYADFLIRSPGQPIVLSACDLGNRAGGTGPEGGTPAAPVCQNGARKAPAKAYFWVARPDSHGCENEGPYPAVDVATGDVYVGYEYNIETNLSNVGPCATNPTSDVMTRVPFSCLPLAPLSGCGGPAARVPVPVTSMVAAFVPGYNRFPLQDFPRVAVSGPAGTVSMVWNDARFSPLGDILLQSFRLGGLAPVQPAPVVLDNPQSGGVHFLPALRYATADGRLDVSWYARDSANTAVTSVDAAVGIDPRITASPPNTRITTVPSDWNNVSSDIVPNFGDYTDNAVNTTGTAPYVGSTLYVAWSDGRLGVPQPFEAFLPAG